MVRISGWSVKLLGRALTAISALRDSPIARRSLCYTGAFKEALLNRFWSLPFAREKSLFLRLDSRFR